jgi:oxygen-independent coproporphyrinogen-3 oxidase
MSSIYLHIPFCRQACHYCDFHFSTKREKQGQMVQALVSEMLLRKKEINNTPVETIYFGGGTPSLLRGEELGILLGAIAENFSLDEQPEITLEANPDDLSDEKLKLLHGLGINRLSIGVQSFQDKDLKFMNRAHNAMEARESITMAMKYFNNISIDLIYGIPDLSPEQWEQNLRTAIQYGIPHISSYALTVEPGTALSRFIEKKVVPPLDDDAAEAQFRKMTEILQWEGYEHYELSNFGKPGFYSRNNTAYWQGKHYLGIGPSAHSYDGLSRKWNIKNNNTYLMFMAEGRVAYEEEVLSNRDRYNEYVMTGLRTIWGVSLEHVHTHFGLKYYEYLLQQALKHLEGQLLYREADTLKVAEKGKFLADGIASDLFMVDLK